MSKFSVAFATGSRADYGIVRKYLEKLDKNSNINLSILPTGVLLDKKYGNAVELIKEDGFYIEKEFDIGLKGTSNSSVIHSMANALNKFGTFFTNNKYDLLIVLGDRYEIFSVAIAAAMSNIPLLHLHGGEATYANYDEFIRHSITKMSLFHFTATEEYRKRVIQLGEAPDRVFNLGALGAENCLFIDEKKVDSDLKKMCKKEYIVILFHPETLVQKNMDAEVDELLKSILLLKNMNYVFIGTNADTNSDVIRKKIQKFVRNNEKAAYFENLDPDSYHYLVKNAICLVGNSSSGIIEAPSLETYTVNIGDRQAGRVKGDSIFNVRCDANQIYNAIMTIDEIHDSEFPTNPYYSHDSANKYYLTTLELLNQISSYRTHPKRFFDLNDKNLEEYYECRR